MLIWGRSNYSGRGLSDVGVVCVIHTLFSLHRNGCTEIESLKGCCAM